MMSFLRIAHHISTIAISNGIKASSKNGAIPSVLVAKAIRLSGRIPGTALLKSSHTLYFSCKF
jgi:hypothetical protein